MHNRPLWNQYVHYITVWIEFEDFQKNIDSCRNVLIISS